MADKFFSNRGNSMLSLSTLRNRLRKNLINNKRGQGATEYILLVAVVVGIVMLFGKNIRTRLEASTEKLGGGIDNVVTESIK